MSEAEMQDLSSWELESLPGEAGSRLAVVVVAVDRAELRNAGKRSQQLLLGGEIASTVAGDVSGRIESLFYHTDREHPEPGDSVVAVLRGSRSGEEILWMIVRFESVDPAGAIDLATAVVSRLRDLMEEDPFRPLKKDE